MAREAQAPVASRWMHKNDPKRRAFFVLERKGFGRVELMQEGAPVFASRTQKELLESWTRLEGKAELPSSYRTQ
jgi:hypothetical protein